jgi:hypothetical protein
MAFANTSYSDVLSTTIEQRSPVIADNVLKNNGLLTRLKKKGKVRSFSGGHKILEPIGFAENGNASWFSGYDQLATAAQDVISSAEFSIKQAAVAVVISGLEMLQNSGKEAMIDLMEARVSLAESSLANLISEGLYSDGTGYGGKQLTGLNAAVVASPSTGTYGGIDRATYTFWRNQTLSTGGAAAATTVQNYMNQLWLKCTRGADVPDLIISDNTSGAAFLNSLQAIQRFTSEESAQLGFASVKFMTADVIFDGGVGGFAPTNAMRFLNTKYLSFRPHAKCNMVPLSPDSRTPFNQDAVAKLIGFAGNLTCSGAQYQGYLSFA